MTLLVFVMMILGSCFGRDDNARLSISRTMSDWQMGVVMFADSIHAGPGDVRSTEAFNEEHVSTPEMLARLKDRHRTFKGDWAALEILVTNLEQDAANVSELKPEDRLTDFKEFCRKQRFIRIHLEGAYLAYAHLEGVHLDYAHLEGAHLKYAHLEGASLRQAHLEEVNIHEAHLEGADALGIHIERAVLTSAHLEGLNLRYAHFEGSILSSAHLEGAVLIAAHFEGAWLGHARLEGAVLTSAYLEGAHLERAHLEGADLSEAHVEEADLFKAHLDGADLRKACFAGANLREARLRGANLEGAELANAVSLEQAILDHANLRVADYAPFDSNQVHRAVIPGNAKDQWSVLRRKYSGPRFFVALILLVGFLLPQIGKALFYSGHDAMVTFAENQYSKIYPTLDRLSQEHSGGLIVHRVADHLTLSAIKVERAYHERYQKWPAVALVLGMHQGWLATLLAVIILPYNYLRARLTLKVGELRDQEERSEVTPSRNEYMALYGQRWYLGHRLLNKLFWVAVISTGVNIGHWALTSRVLVAT